MERIDGVLQINSVMPGTIGGAIFSGRIQGQRRITVCKADYKTITRIPQSGECWRITGYKTKHDEYKTYITVEQCHLVSLPEAAYVKGFLLKHPDFRGFGFGAKKVEKLINSFGAFALVSALNNAKTEHIAEILNQELSEMIVATWIRLRNETETVTFLVENKIPMSLAKRILKICSFDTVNRIKSNPYVLVAFSDVVPNIWQIIDTIANKVGIKKDDSKRLVGAIELVLYKRLEAGHTATDLSFLHKEFSKYVTADLFKLALKYAFEAKTVCSINRGNEQLIQPIGAALIEQTVETKIQHLISTPYQLNLQSNINEIIDLYSKSHYLNFGFPLNSKQKDAVKAALTQRICVITGFGGTGKTTVLRAIVEIADREVIVLALSGKAKERAKSASGSETFTIHGFMQKVRNSPSSVSNQLLIIIDESSMVDIGLINQLFKILGERDFSLIMMGDTGQLSPVGYGIFWHKLARSELIPIVHLTEVHRTSSPELHSAAMNVRNGKLVNIPEWDGEKKGIFFVTCEQNQKALLNELIDIRSKVHSDHQIITPHMYRGAVDSGDAINKAIQYSVHSVEDSEGIYLGSSWIKVGDPVLVTHNNYEIGLFNGNTGRLLEITSKEETARGKFQFDGRDYELSLGDMWELGIRLAYAISIHKSQGSEYDTSIVCTLTNSEFLERSMLYTAITRSKNLTLLVGCRDIARNSASKPNRSDSICVGFDINEIS